MMSFQPGSDNRTQAELLHDLQYGSHEEQEEALAQLSAVGEAEALDAVVNYLREQPYDAPDAAIDTLRVLATKYMPVDRYSLAEVLTPYLLAPDWGQRLAAVRLFNAYPTELAIEPLRQVIDDAREKVYTERHQRSSPTRLLAERTLAESILALANSGRLLALDDMFNLMDDPALRVLATRGLGIIGSETERDHLDELCEDYDPRVRDAAQWALGLMDERVEQFLNPPMDVPEPPPDRLNPIYWAHRQLYAADDEVLQFLIVRIALEHLILDQFLSEGRVPESCQITAQRYTSDTPPAELDAESEVIGVWEYHWHGPTLEKRRAGRARTGERPGLPASRSASITISYPEDLPFIENGLVGFHYRFAPFSDQRWLCYVTRRDDGWTFSHTRTD